MLIQYIIKVNVNSVHYKNHSFQVFFEIVVSKECHFSFITLQLDT
jgi:hypothetical protein